MFDSVISAIGDYTPVAFGGVVRLSKERAKNPETEGYNRVVGLEHIDPGDLRIRRWAEASDGTSFSSIFKPGHVLFGKRRAYQRKVAVAEFAGICSSDIYVLEPSNDALLPELLAFICQTDSFLDHAVGTSAGSLSPRTNWKNLASFEFHLPPIQEQTRLVEIFTSGRRFIENLEDAHESANQLHSAFAMDMVAKFRDNAKSVMSIGDIAEVRYGLTVSNARRHMGEEKPYLRVANVLRGRLDLGEVKTIGVLPGDEKYILTKGDVLLVEGNIVGGIGRACIWEDEIPDAMHQNHLIRIRAGKHADYRYICSLVNSPIGQKYFQSRAKSSCGLSTINLQDVKEFQIPLPSLEDQIEELSKLDQISTKTADIENRLHYARRLYKIMLNGGKDNDFQ